MNSESQEPTGEHYIDGAWTGGSGAETDSRDANPEDEQQRAPGDGHAECRAERRRDGEDTEHEQFERHEALVRVSNESTFEA
jgi:hypothetical protein